MFSMDTRTRNLNDGFWNGCHFVINYLFLRNSFVFSCTTLQGYCFGYWLVSGKISVHLDSWLRLFSLWRITNNQSLNMITNRFIQFACFSANLFEELNWVMCTKQKVLSSKLLLTKEFYRTPQPSITSYEFSNQNCFRSTFFLCIIFENFQKMQRKIKLLQIVHINSYKYMFEN